MVKNIWDVSGLDLGYGKPNKKRKALTPTQRLWHWEHGTHTCYICHKRITKLSDAEFDHTRAYSKGGVSIKISHKLCNRMKGKYGLTEIQKRLGVKITKRKTKKESRKKKPKQINPFDVDIKIPKIEF